jgi:hypothetical protein
MATTATAQPRISSSQVRQDIFPLDQWTITTRKGIIMQSKCTCKSQSQQQQQQEEEEQLVSKTPEKEFDKEPIELCDICRYHRLLPQLHSMPDMLFNNNLFRLEHSSGVGIEFNPLDALRSVRETSDPLRVAVADGWQSAYADCPFAKHISRPFDWTFTTNYRGTLLSAIRSSIGSVASESRIQSSNIYNRSPTGSTGTNLETNESDDSKKSLNQDQSTLSQDLSGKLSFDETQDRLSLIVEETDERIDVNKLKVKEEILFYDDITLYEDELADHGTAQYSVKVRVMPNSLFILARYYLRIDGVMARINDTRIYHELKQSYILREYTNREAKLSNLNLPLSTVVNPSELMNHLPLIEKRYEKLILPSESTR